jgi:membrane protein DedA with SNARE-associated domain/rhodanese-related sulfurtransferase
MNYYLVHTTYPILFVVVFARQLCIPLPSILFLLSAGALAGSGKLSYAGVLAVATLGCVLADSVWFEAGRLRGKRVLRLLCALAPDPSHCIRKARATFAGRGLNLLLIAKFVPGLDGVCPPLAGMSGTTRRSFIVHDAAGAALWSGTYITCGFVFAKELEQIARYTSVLANALILIFGIPFLIFFVWKMLLLLRLMRLLRSRQIAPELLKARLDEGQKVGVIDLLRFEDDPEEIVGIPGAVRLDPGELRHKRKIILPDGLDVVLYCRSKNSFVSARVAAVMRGHGIDSVYVLAGGLSAWEAMKFPVSLDFATPEEELARLGIEVHPPWKSTSDSVSVPNR